MHFRLRENVVQLIRTTYDSASKRAKSERIGNVSRAQLTLSDDVAKKLTSDELREFETFALSYRLSTKLQAKVYAFQLSEIVRQVLEAAGEAEGEELELIMGNLTQSSQEIRAYIARKARSEA